MTLSKAEHAARKARAAEKLALIRRAIEDGWPLREIYRTHQTSHTYVKKQFPDYTGLPAQESGSLSMAIQQRGKK